MPRLTTTVLAHRRAVIAAWLRLTVAGALAARTIPGSLSQSFEAPGRPAFAVNQRILERFATGAVVAERLSESRRAGRSPQPQRDRERSPGPA